MNKKNSFLYFCFAGFTCKVAGKPEKIDYIKKCYLKSPFAKFIKKSLKSKSPHATLAIKTIKTKSNLDSFKLTSDYQKLIFRLECSENIFFLFPVIEQVLRRIFYILFFKNNGFIIHASAVVHDDKVLIFAGSTGTGKSTIVNILSSDPRFYQIADNNVYVKKEKKNFFIYKSPFLEWNVHYKDQIQPSDKLRLHKIFILHKAKKNEIKMTKFKEAIDKIARQIQLPLGALSSSEEQESRKIIFDFISKNIQKNIFNLRFQKDSAIIETIKMNLI